MIWRFDLCRPHSGLMNTSARPVWIALEEGQDLGSSAVRVWTEEDADVGRRDLQLGWTRRRFFQNLYSSEGRQNMGTHVWKFSHKENKNLLQSLWIPGKQVAINFEQRYPLKTATVASKKWYLSHGFSRYLNFHHRNPSAIWTQVQQGCYGLGVGLVLQTLKLQGWGRDGLALGSGKSLPNDIDVSGWWNVKFT